MIYINVDLKQAYEKRLIRDRDLRKHELYRELTDSAYHVFLDIIEPLCKQFGTWMTLNDYDSNTAIQFVDYYLKELGN